MQEGQEREHFASRIGFILVAAGCAIGIGNVWRFPYITGQYGGAAFVLLYLVFLVILGLPVMVMEFSVGRASQKSSALAFDILQPKRTFHWFGWWGYIGCMILMMFYTTVAGWMHRLHPQARIGAVRQRLRRCDGTGVLGHGAKPGRDMIVWMLVAVAIGFVTCAVGLQKGVERITKVMMAALFVIMLLLCIRSMTLPGAGEGIAFYLLPDFSHLFAGDTPAEQWGTFGQAVYAAMGQAFFSLSLGIAAMESLRQPHRQPSAALTGEALRHLPGSTPSSPSSPASSSFPPASRSRVSPDARRRRSCSSRCPTVFGQMPLGPASGARCSSCS